jgi:predicted O-linked N-acetylglucosamine transferase (SPINDLY family)
VTASAADTRVLQGFALHQQGRLPEAASAYREVLEAQPRHFDALHLLGLVALQSQEAERAAELLARAVESNPMVAAAHLNRGAALARLARLSEALASYDRAIELAPDYADAYFNRGNVLAALNRREAAADSYGKAALLRPDLADAHHQRGRLLHTLGRSEEAVACLDRAVSLRPGTPAILNDRGVALCALRRLPAALADFTRVAQLEAVNPAAHHHLGLALHGLGRNQEALESFDRSLELRSDVAEVHHDRAGVLFDLKNYVEAIEGYGRAIELKPDLKYLYGFRQHLRMKICDWRGLEDARADIAMRIARGEAASPAFAVLALSDSASLQRQAAAIFGREECPSCAEPTGLAAPAAVGARPQDTRIRVGYFSADYHDHATTRLMAGLFEEHDRARFEVTAFSFGPRSQDAMRRRIEASCERFLDVRDRSDAEVARLARDLGIDIAVDLKGCTWGARPGIFACRAAPLQVSYLGYPGTMAAGHIDYLVADATLVPEGSRVHYAERIIYLPGTYQINDRRRPMAGAGPARSDLGLPPAGRVFCCFNDSYKVTPDVFGVWMRILERVEGSVLWLLEDNPTAATNLRSEALRRGVSPERLVFAKRVELAQHLARHGAADLFLDTLPCNAHTTASDALWAGLPLLTCAGEAFAARVAASLLNAAGLTELVTSSLAEYEERAVALAGDPGRLARLRQQLAEQRHRLFDPVPKTRQLEAAYTEILARQQAGEPPAHVHVRG